MEAATGSKCSTFERRRRRRRRLLLLLLGLRPSAGEEEGDGQAERRRRRLLFLFALTCGGRKRGLQVPLDPPLSTPRLGGWCRSTGSESLC
jgi:hypothetical protein